MPTALPPRVNTTVFRMAPKPADMIDELLAPYQPVDIGRRFPIELPPFGEKGEKKIEISPSTAGYDPKANLLVANPAEEDKFRPIILKYGLLLRMRDTETGKESVRRIRIEPQRPSGYL
jgi:hypothetical protein